MWRYLRFGADGFILNRGIGFVEYLSIAWLELKLSVLTTLIVAESLPYEIDLRYTIVRYIVIMCIKDWIICKELLMETIRDSQLIYWREFQN